MYLERVIISQLCVIYLTVRTWKPAGARSEGLKYKLFTRQNYLTPGHSPLTSLFLV